MSIVQKLSSLAVPYLFKGTCEVLGVALGEQTAESAGKVFDGAVRFLHKHFSDHSQQLTEAVQRANDRAWRALEIALAGDSWWARIKGTLTPAEDKGLARQVRAYLQVAPLPAVQGNEPVRQRCLQELRAAYKNKVLTSGSLDLRQLVEQAGALVRFDDPQKTLNAQLQLLNAVGDELGQTGFKMLGKLLQQRPTQGAPLLVLLVRYFFRREIETRPELFRGLTWSKLEHLDEAQKAGFDALNDALQRHGQRLEQLLTEVREVVVQTQQVVLQTHGDVLDIKAEIQGIKEEGPRQIAVEVFRLLEQRQLHRRELRTGDSLSIRNDAERQAVKQAIAGVRALPARQQTPALLNAVGKLGVLAGDLDAAQADFQKVTTLVDDNAAKAEAHYNVYQTALERREWKTAFAELIEAVKLDGKRFAPFPVGKYVPQRILGAGGFGVAFLCKHKLMDAYTVVKALRLDDLDRDAEKVFREAQLLRQLDHPAVIRIQDCDFVDKAAKGHPYLVMDYFDGLTLEEHVRRHGPLAVDDVVSLATAMAGALQAAHSKGVLHRDVKPANILVRAKSGNGGTIWEVKLIDFGLAVRRESLTSTRRGMHAGQSTLVGGSIAGTLNYAAPEQRGQVQGVAVGPYSDVYGLAKTCCYALFQTTQPLPKHWKTLPEPLADLLEKCLEEDPKKRPKDCGPVLEWLAGCQGQAAPADASDDVAAALLLEEGKAVSSKSASHPSWMAPPVATPNSTPAPTSDWRQPSEEPSAWQESPSRPVPPQKPPARRAASGGFLNVVALLLVLAGGGWLASYALRPLTPREVCEHFNEAKTPAEAKKYCTLNLQPAVDALLRQKSSDSDEPFEFTQESQAPPDVGGYYVGFRGQTCIPEQHRRVQVDGVIHLIKAETWKVEDRYFLSVDRQPLPQPISLASDYALMLEDQTGATPPTPAPRSSQAAAAQTKAKSWYDDPTVRQNTARTIGGWLSSGGGKVIWAALAAIGLGLLRFIKELLLGSSGEQK